MSKTRYADKAPRPTRLGDWLSELRERLELPLRAVANATDMDLAHLHKIEQGQRLPTQEQASRLARFFRLDETEIQARRIADRFRQEFAANPAAKEAISILAEEAGAYVSSAAREFEKAPASVAAVCDRRPRPDLSAASAVTDRRYSITQAGSKPAKGPRGT